ncbi:MAG TPA: ribosome silencing factor [Candidatus Dormibacteraeota bacterium]
MSEIDPQELSQALLAVAEDRKAWDAVMLDVRGKTTIADFFVVCEGETDRQLRAIADAMLKRAKELETRPLHVSGYEDATWILLDFDAVVAHIFLPGERAYYDLEGLWTEAARRRRSSAS